MDSVSISQNKVLMGLFGNVHKNLEQMCPKLLQSLFESISQIEAKQLINSKFSEFI